MTNKSKVNSTTIFGVAAFAGYAAAKMLRRNGSYSLSEKTVMITGGSRGLGFLLAKEFSRRGARVAITGRDQDSLKRAEGELRRFSSDVLAISADMTMQEEVETTVAKVRRELSEIDVLVNNAGTICVGPAETMEIGDYRNSLNTHFWAPYFASMAVLPRMKERRQGRIVNISSIGGKLSVPHLLPYCVGKFALTGFSEGLRSVALKDNVFITTVCPGLMRTGSPRNATFKGDNEAEYAWFSIGDALPLLSMDAKRAARKIVNACIRGDAEIILSLPANIAAQLHGAFPNATADVLALAERLLPGAKAAATRFEAKTGRESFSDISPSWLTALNERAAAENNQVP